MTSSKSESTIFYRLPEIEWIVQFYLVPKASNFLKPLENNCKPWQGSKSSVKIRQVHFYMFWCLKFGKFWKTIFTTRLTDAEAKQIDGVKA